MQDLTTTYKWSQRQIIFSLLILLLCCLIGYWPVSAGLFSLKNDATLYFLPVRYQISEMIRHGDFPFWTPYVNLGHPLYTDMQSGVWNPFVWLISLCGSYTMRSLQIELLIYVYISGVSMFYLLKYFKLNPAVCLALAACYMLCGFNSDSAQFPYWICGTAFFPFVFLFFLRTLNEVSWKPAVLLSVSLYFLFTTGYPAEFIIVFYLLLAYFIVYIISNKKNFFGLLKILSLSVISFLILSLPAILAYSSGLEYISRGGSISHDLVMTNSMHPSALISWLLPLSVWKIPTPGTDLLGKNSFIGLLPFLLLLVSFLIKSKNNLLIFLKWVFIISLILSLGKIGLLRSAAYYILPYMDTFRHPSLFRFVTIFCGCILAAYSLEQFIINKEAIATYRKTFFIVIALILLISIIIFITSNSQNSNFFPVNFTAEPIKEWMKQSTVSQWLLIELVIQLPFLFLIFHFVIKKKNLQIAGLLCIANSLIHTMLVQPITVVRTETVKHFNDTIDKYKQPGFPFPGLNTSVKANSFTDTEHSLAYGPVTMYSKKIGYQYVYVTPGPLVGYERFIANPNLNEHIFNFPFFYRADTALNIIDSMALPKQKKFILSDDLAINNFININGSAAYNIRLTSFSPNEIEFEIDSDKPGFYCFVQNFYPNWELFINNKKETINKSNINLMGCKVPEGKNKIKFRFRHNIVLFSIYIQLAALLVLLTMLILSSIPRRIK